MKKLNKKKFIVSIKKILINVQKNDIINRIINKQTNKQI